MKSYEAQIFSVAKVVYETWKLHADGAGFMLHKDKLAAYPDADVILKKLQYQYGVIEIVTNPNDEVVVESHLKEKYGKTLQGKKSVDNVLSYGLIATPKLEGFIEMLAKDYGAAPQELVAVDDKIRFDVKASTLTMGSIDCNIPDESLEHYVCKFAFKNRKVPAKEDDILEKNSKSQDSQRAVYDAHLRINKRAKDAFGIEKLLVYKAAKIRINKKYQ